MDQTVARPDQFELAPQRVGVAVPGRCVPDGVPGVPVSAQEKSTGSTPARAALHYGIVDRGSGGLGEDVRVEPQEVEVALGGVCGGAGRAEHVGRLSFELGQDDVGAEQELPEFHRWPCSM